MQIFIKYNDLLIIKYLMIANIDTYKCMYVLNKDLASNLAKVIFDTNIYIHLHVILFLNIKFWYKIK